MKSDFWDTRFDGAEYLYGTAPNDFLVAVAPLLPVNARVLVPGDGEGRNGVWLAQQGHDVTSVDWSAVGLAKTRSLAASAGLSITTIEADLATFAWPVGLVDAVVLIFLHLPVHLRSQIHRRAVQALKPGGLLILEGFSKAQIRLQKTEGSGGPRNSDMLFDQEMLTEDFGDLDIQRLDTREREIAEGKGHLGRGAVIQMLARGRAAPEDGGQE